MYIYVFTYSAFAAFRREIHFSLMKQFWKNLIRYRSYASYAAVANLKKEVSGSYFSWLWWILDPFLFMMVYSFVSLVVFGKSEPHFIPFVFTGYGIWSFFSRSVTQSVKLVRNNKSILSRVYLPKYILLISMTFENFIRYLITLVLCFIISLFDHVVFSLYLLWFPAILCCLLLFVFGVCTIMMHIGVYAKDMGNITTVLLKLMFYLSGIFYSISKRVPAPYGKMLLWANPMALFIDEARQVTIYASAPKLLPLAIWFVISLLLSAIGIHLVHKHEQSYVKAI